MKGQLSYDAKFYVPSIASCILTVCVTFPDSLLVAYSSGDPANKLIPNDEPSNKGQDQSSSETDEYSREQSPTSRMSLEEEEEEETYSGTAETNPKNPNTKDSHDSEIDGSQDVGSEQRLVMASPESPNQQHDIESETSSSENKQVPNVDGTTGRELDGYGRDQSIEQDKGIILF